MTFSQRFDIAGQLIVVLCSLMHSPVNSVYTLAWLCVSNINKQKCDLPEWLYWFVSPLLAVWQNSYSRKPAVYYSWFSFIDLKGASYHFRWRNSNSESWFLQHQCGDIKLRNIIFFFHNWMNKLFLEENKVTRTLFVARKVAGTATYKQSKTVWHCTFNVTLFIQFIQSWKQRWFVYLFLCQ